MKPNDFVSLLLNRGDNPADELSRNVRIFFDRLLLRLFSVSQLSAHLCDAAVDRKGNDIVIELDFARLPVEIFPQVIQLTGVEQENVSFFEFEKDGQSRTGVKVTLPSSDFDEPDSDKSWSVSGRPAS